MFCVEGITPDVLVQKGDIDLIQAMSRKTGVRLVQMEEKLKAQTCGQHSISVDSWLLEDVSGPGRLFDFQHPDTWIFPSPHFPDYC